MLVVGKVGGAVQRRLRRDWKTLLLLSESPIPSRAITLITDKVASLEYTITPKKGHEDEDYTQEIETLQRVIDNPNHEDEDWPTFVRQIVEDQLVFDTGVFEYVERPPFIDGNDIVALFPVPGWSIEKVSGWDGNPRKPRWMQRTDGGNDKGISLLDSQLEVLITRKRTSKSYGLAPLEVAVGLMDALLGLQSYQAEVASNAYPAFLLSLGKEVSEPQAQDFRRYWEQDLRGVGRPGIVGNMDDPKSIALKAVTDDGLYPKYKDTLTRMLAFTFKLKPQDFGIERDVNKAQGEISQAASIEEAVKPYARMLASRATTRIFPRVARLTNQPRILDLVFTYENIDPWDEKERAEIQRIQLETDQRTIDEVRGENGLEPLANGLGGLTLSEYRATVGYTTNPTGDTEPVN